MASLPTDLQAEQVFNPFRYLTRCEAFRKRTVVAITVAMVILAGSATSFGQSKVGIQLSGGPVVTAGSTFRLVPNVGEVQTNEDINGEPTLRNWRNGPGFHLGLGLLLNELLVYYRLERLGWRDDTVACRVDEDAPDARSRAVTLPNGRVDDLAVDYACVSRRDRDTAEILDRDAFVMHSIGGAFQLYADRIRRPELYASFGGALLLTTNHIRQDYARVRAGVRLHAGGGLDYFFDDNIALNAEIRYEFSALGKDGSYTLNANRAAEAERTVLAAVFEPMHSFSLTIGVRIYLRR